MHESRQIKPLAVPSRFDVVHAGVGAVAGVVCIQAAAFMQSLGFLPDSLSLLGKAFGVVVVGIGAAPLLGPPIQYALGWSTERIMSLWG